MIPNTKYKILAIIGPTSSGKSELAVQLAKLFNGEIISADSRQIYKGMNLGTGKVKGKWLVDNMRTYAQRQQVFFYKNIPHYLIDFANPRRQYSAALFQRDAKKVIADVCADGKLPIICGGTGHWVDAVVYDQPIPDAKPNLKLRLRLGKKSATDLYKQLKKLDPHRAKNIDRQNKRRMIRALEIISATGKPVPALTQRIGQAQGLQLQPLWLGIKTNRPDLYKKIDKRLKQRLKQGMVKEILRLRKQGLSWKRLMSFGLEYKFISLYLQKKISYQKMLGQLSYAIKHYSKRQLTWWKRNKDIVWINKKQARNKVEKFLK